MKMGLAVGTLMYSSSARNIVSMLCNIPLMIKPKEKSEKKYSITVYLILEIEPTGSE